MIICGSNDPVWFSSGLVQLIDFQGRRTRSHTPNWLTQRQKRMDLKSAITFGVDASHTWITPMGIFVGGSASAHRST